MPTLSASTNQWQLYSPRAGITAHFSSQSLPECNNKTAEIRDGSLEAFNRDFVLSSTAIAVAVAVNPCICVCICISPSTHLHLPQLLHYIPAIRHKLLHLLRKCIKVSTGLTLLFNKAGLFPKFIKTHECKRGFYLVRETGERVPVAFSHRLRHACRGLR